MVNPVEGGWVPEVRAGLGGSLALDISVSGSGLDVRGRGVIAAAAFGPGCAGVRGGSRLLRFGVAGIGGAAEGGGGSGCYRGFLRRYLFQGVICLRLLKLFLSAAISHVVYGSPSWQFLRLVSCGRCAVLFGSVV